MSPELATELERKRLAVLASLKKNRSQSPQTQGISDGIHDRTQISINGTKGKADTAVSQVSKEDIPMVLPSMDDLLDAVLDLRRLGYSFDKIVKESGVSIRFLEMCYDYWGFPVVREPPPSVVLAPVPAKSKRVLENRNVWTPVVNSRPKFDNKFTKETERPEWLNNLVFSLESSDEEEESDCEDPEEKKNTMKVEAVVHTHESSKRPASADAHVDNVKRRRKSVDDSDSLEEILLQKKQLNFKMELLSKKIRKLESKRTTQYDEEIALKDKSITSLQQQAENLEESLANVRTKLANDIETRAALVKERNEIQSSKESLANGLIQLETLSETESKLRREQKGKSQRKIKKNVEKIVEKTVEAAVETTNDENTEIGASLISGETIHKIPKVIPLHS